MKLQKSLWVILAAGYIQLIMFVSCGRSPLPESYLIRFPPLPPSWKEILGENRWRLDYYDSDGIFRQTETSGGAVLGLFQDWPGAVLAWPYWPEKNLAAGLFCPAGAVFPFDRAGGTITLSWEAGAEAYFYHELDKAQYLNSGTNRKPEFFDWERFRTLLRETAPEELRKDPWLADWKTIAERTVRSGFRQSYVRAETRSAAKIIMPHDGPWIGVSPFGTAESWTKGEEAAIFLSSRPEILVCPGGRLSLSESTRLWQPFQSQSAGKIALQHSWIIRSQGTRRVRNPVSRITLETMFQGVPTGVYMPRL